ncbi:hypothetical protein ACX40Y_02025 [Sphingomonas sp. RS6]
MVRLPRNADLRSLIVVVPVVILYNVISDVTGFRSWVNNDPIASIVMRILAVLIFGGVGAAGLIFGRHDPEMRRPIIRLMWSFMLLIAVVNAAILFSGAKSFSDLFSE